MSAHGMAGNALARHIDREMLRDERRQFLLDIRSHAEIGGPGFLRRIDVEARTLAEIIPFVIGYVIAARARVGRHEDDAVFGTSRAELALFGDIGMSAGEAGQVPQNGQLRPFGMVRHKGGKGHGRTGFHRMMGVDALGAAVAAVLADSLECHFSPRYKAHSLLPSGSRR